MSERDKGNSAYNTFQGVQRQVMTFAFHATFTDKWFFLILSIIVFLILISIRFYYWE